MSTKGIAHLPDMVAALSPSERELFHRLFHLSTTVGRLNPPPSMHPWIEEHFGSLEMVLVQRIIKVTNLVTWEGALFNEIRSQRPMEATVKADLREAIIESEGDPFCHPTEGTPEDSFGRVKGSHSVTASNIAKYDGFHGLVIFDQHDPLRFSQEEVADYIDTALAWAQEANSEEPEAKYLFFMWNCLWKAGASIIHGHAQMTLSREMHYAKIERLRRAALDYRATHGGNYFDDLYRIHASLGLASTRKGTRLLAYLTPVKEKEILLLSPELDNDLKEAIFGVLRCYVESLGVSAFNLAFIMPPLALAKEDWGGFPVMVRLLDRGDPMNRTADIGAMELYASSVISSDPFQVAAALGAPF
ncbi:MAG: hypothetical protein ACE5II_00130 [Anaerolineae bacterium]